MVVDIYEVGGRDREGDGARAGNVVQRTCSVHLWECVILFIL